MFSQRLILIFDRAGACPRACESQPATPSTSGSGYDTFVAVEEVANGRI